MLVNLSKDEIKLVLEALDFNYIEHPEDKMELCKPTAEVSKKLYNILQACTCKEQKEAN